MVFEFFGTKALSFPGFDWFSNQKPLPSLAHSAGTSQKSGASLVCDPCLKGEYQDQTGQQSCLRCGVGDYQDEEGGPVCKKYLGEILLHAFCGKFCSAEI